MSFSKFSTATQWIHAIIMHWYHKSETINLYYYHYCRDYNTYFDYYRQWKSFYFTYVMWTLRIKFQKMVEIRKNLVCARSLIIDMYLGDIVYTNNSHVRVSNSLYFFCYNPKRLYYAIIILLLDKMLPADTWCCLILPVSCLPSLVWASFGMSLSMQNVMT